MKVSTKIRKIREFKGYSQEYMSDILGMSQASYSKLEKNDGSISIEKLKSISQILEVKLIDLLNFDDSHIFNNNNQQGGNAASILINSFSEKMLELYEFKIKSLEDKVKRLENRN